MYISDRDPQRETFVNENLSMLRPFNLTIMLAFWIFSHRINTSPTIKYKSELSVFQFHIFEAFHVKHLVAVIFGSRHWVRMWRFKYTIHHKCMTTPVANEVWTFHHFTLCCFQSSHNSERSLTLDSMFANYAILHVNWFPNSNMKQKGPKQFHEIHLQYFTVV